MTGGPIIRQALGAFVVAPPRASFNGCSTDRQEDYAMYFKDFKVTVNQEDLGPDPKGDFSDREYPVLALEIDGDEIDVLLADDMGKLVFLDSNEVKVVVPSSLDKQRGQK